MENLKTQYRLVKTRLQQKDLQAQTQCNLCLWRCKLKHGQRGFCQAHVNRHGTLFNLTYGIISAMEVNPIEDKPVRHFKPGSRVLSIGSFGCNFRCPGCHNLEVSWGLEALDKLALGQSTEAFLTAEQIVRYALEQNVQGIAFTYSEPAVWLEYVVDVSRLAKQAGLYTVYVSNSFVTIEALQCMAPYMDVLCSDIKSFEDDFYHDICKKSSVEQILEAIAESQRLGIHVETRTNVIPTKNDDLDNLKSIAKWIYQNLGSESPWHITKFFPAYRLAHLPPTPNEILWKAHDVARKIGLKNVYVYDDVGCDCATTNDPISAIVNNEQENLFSRKSCVQDCCGEQGILLKKYEQQLCD